MGKPDLERFKKDIRRWANGTAARFGGQVYLVGSALTEEDPRDWDIRVVITDEAARANGWNPDDRPWDDHAGWEKQRLRENRKMTVELSRLFRRSMDCQLQLESQAVRHDDEPRLRLDAFEPDCPTCGGAGFTVTGETDAPEQVQCQDCFQERVFGGASPTPGVRTAAEKAHDILYAATGKEATKCSGCDEDDRCLQCAAHAALYKLDDALGEATAAESNCKSCNDEAPFGCDDCAPPPVGWYLAVRPGEKWASAHREQYRAEAEAYPDGLQGNHGEVVEVWEVPPELEPLRQLARDVHEFFTERTPHALSCKPAHHYQVTKEIASRFVEMSKAALRLAGEQVSDLDALMETMAAQAEEENSDA